MKSKNIKEFKALILRYESISIGEIFNRLNDDEFIGDEHPDFYIFAQRLTGFGGTHSCTLCKAVGREPMKKFGFTYPNCKNCIWYRTISNKEIHHQCCDGKNLETYDKINNAIDAEKLLAGFKARAAYMRTILTKLRIKQP